MEVEKAIKILKAQLDTKTEKGYYKPMCEEETRLVLNHIAKQDKMIKLMVEHIKTGCDFDNRIQNTSQIKQHFEKKAEESE